VEALWRAGGERRVQEDAGVARPIGVAVGCAGPGGRLLQELLCV
jgi:hypothetical protein